MEYDAIQAAGKVSIFLLPVYKSISFITVGVLKKYHNGNRTHKEVTLSIQNSSLLASGLQIWKTYFPRQDEGGEEVISLIGRWGNFDFLSL